MHARAWWRDFSLEGGAVRVHATGALVPLSRAVISDVLHWLPYYLAVESRRPGVAQDGPVIAFAPHAPRPWYQIWAAVHLAGLRVSDDLRQADILFHFCDATHSPRPPGWTGPGFNLDCSDISKSRVAGVFETVSGRQLLIDPEQFDGAFVDKSEANAAHDGRVRTQPCPPAAGRCYQRLIETAGPDGMAEDLRCVMAGGEIAALFVKRRPASRRFENHNAEVFLADPGVRFSTEERRLLRQFCHALHLDWGGLDVLRDRATGEIWIVDANKTDMGPPVSMALGDRLEAIERIAAALRRHCESLLGWRRAA
ncbi:hypothetical protein F1654_00495 [Alkalicaulis satelles]|uniref:ATP-grasp domain-containing protein n=1 Tax=Alkalicaulis satelles TaxID=2609175 RepID=A0A5M6ZI75_9PROT|nr:hypothetical protein [Alkalicaulis satelles]KAA5804523.1 hypothetical protein F1654_00495 [Alkalicaulis satelles]